MKHSAKKHHTRFGNRPATRVTLSTAKKINTARRVLYGSVLHAKTMYMFMKHSKSWIERLFSAVYWIQFKVSHNIGLLKCRLGFHIHTKEQLVHRGIKPPKSRNRYYHHCFICGKYIK